VIIERKHLNITNGAVVNLIVLTSERQCGERYIARDYAMAAALEEFGEMPACTCGI
jgi:hypothetical protein